MFVVEVRRGIACHPTIEMVVMSNHRAAGTQCLDQRGISTADTVAVDIEATKVA
ncbi:hypothetical protein D9M71_750280 [compost metagenome]